MPDLEQAALSYWKHSQRFQALDPREREGYVEFVVKDAISEAYDPRHQLLLGRIVSRLAA